MSDCFLIADEVGLGKTIIAQKVAEYVYLHDNRLCLFYVASNTRIAEQNIKEFMLDKFIGNVDRKKIVTSQEKTARAAIQAFFSKDFDTISNEFKSRNSNPKHPVEKCMSSGGDRLSLMNKWSDKYVVGDDIQSKNTWDISNITPATSFKTDKGEVLKGSKTEVNFLNDIISRLQRVNLSVNEKREYTQLDLFILALAFLEKIELKEESLGQLKEEINSINLDGVDNKDFRLMRSASSLVSILIKQPNLIILDEFQRFRYALSDNRNGNSDSFTVKVIRDFIDYVNNLKLGISISQPKILLLSATPYQFNMNAIDDTTEENPFQTFDELKKAIEGLGGDISEYKKYIARTERRFFIDADENALFSTEFIDEIIGSEGIKRHNEYLMSVYKNVLSIKDVDEREKALDIIDTLLQDTPNFWEYKDYIIKNYEFDKNNIVWQTDFSTCKADDFNKINLIQTKINESGLDNILWIPPTNSGKMSGKIIVFMKYHRTSVAVSNIINKKYGSCVDKLCNIEKANLEQALKEKISFIKESKQDIAGYMADYLLIPRSISVICRYYNLKPEELMVSNIIDYCNEFELSEVLAEYLQVCGGNLFQYGFWNKKEGKITYTEIKKMDSLEFAINMLEESNEMSDKEKIAMFNSPFYPFVVCATESAQEGIDLHSYSDKIIHWSLPANASAMIQRDGRIDRADSYVIRCRLNQSKGADFKDKYKDAVSAGIWPKWYIPNLDNYHKITRVFCGSKLSGYEKKDNNMIKATAYYPEFLYGASKEDYCPFFYE